MTGERERENVVLITHNHAFVLLLPSLPLSLSLAPCLSLSQSAWFLLIRRWLGSLDLVQVAPLVRSPTPADRQAPKASNRHGERKNEQSKPVWENSFSSRICC